MRLLQVFTASMFIAAVSWSQSWDVSLKAGFEKAKKEKKSIVVFVTSRQCKWCKKMEETTLKESDVQKALGEFVRIKVEQDSDEIRMLPKIDGVPTFFFLDSCGKITMEALGFIKKDEFLSLVRDSLSIMASESKK